MNNQTLNNQSLPAPDALAYRMLALTALCGEVPVRQLYRLPGGEQYKEKVITSLKKEKLQLLCDPAKRATLDAILLSELQPPGPDQTIDHDALDAQGRPVLFSYLPDIPRLNWYIGALLRFERPGCIACFDFQARVLKNSFGPLVSFLAISFEKIQERIFPA